MSKEIARLTLLGGRLAVLYPEIEDGHFVDVESADDVFGILKEYDITMYNIDKKIGTASDHTDNFELILILRHFYCMLCQLVVSQQVFEMEEILA